MNARVPPPVSADWRDHLTGFERKQVEALEQRQREARAALAEASASIATFCGRACHRRLATIRAQTRRHRKIL